VTAAVMAVLLPILEALLAALVPVITGKLYAPITVEDMQPVDPDLRRYLRDRVRSAENGDSSSR
jgi:hypothetical protein